MKEHNINVRLDESMSIKVNIPSELDILTLEGLLGRIQKILKVCEKGEGLRVRKKRMDKIK